MILCRKTRRLLSQQQKSKETNKFENVFSRPRTDGRTQTSCFSLTSRQKFLKGLGSNIICINTTVLHRRYGGFECQNYSMTLSFAERQDKTIPGDHASFVFHFFKGHKNISQSNRHHYQASSYLNTPHTKLTI